jgi:DNA-binding protein YbaB
LRPDDNAGTGFYTGETDPERMLADITARAARLRETAEGVAAQLAETSGTGQSPDGAVTATVAPTGALQDIKVNARATKMSPEQLSHSIMAAVRAAQAKASAALVSAFQPLGEGTDTMNMILDYIPKPDEVDELPGEEQPEFAAIEDPEPPAPAPKAPAPPPPTRPNRPASEDEVDSDPW